MSPGVVKMKAQEDYSLENMNLDRKDDDSGDYYNTMLNRNVFLSFCQTFEFLT